MKNKAKKEIKFWKSFSGELKKFGEIEAKRTERRYIKHRRKNKKA